MNDAEWREAWSLFRAAAEPDGAVQPAALDSVDARIAAEVQELLRDRSEELAAAAPPELFGRYRIERLIGEGGIGAVYAARDPELNRTVALKFVSDRVAGLPATLELLTSEARAASALNHPNIVTIYDVLRDGNRAAIAAEVVEGFALRTRCGAPAPMGDVLAWGSQIASGLAAAHAQGIVHRDIKPENIMVRPDGLVKILDFGLARRIEGQETLWEVPLGTLGYMAPEQIRGERLTGAADVFSLGVVLFELAAGVHPFLAGTRTATTRAITSAEPFTLTGAKPPSLLRPLLRRMLAKEPADRPAICAVLAELETLQRRGARPARARRALVWSLAGVLAAAGALIVSSGSRTGEWPQFREVPFTSYAGSETEPAFSPDGSRIAFTWRTDSGQYRDVYVKDLSEGEPRRLTSGESDHYAPAWSPDGQRIAFLQGVRGFPQDVVVVPASGGSARLVTRIADHEGWARPIAWWPDGESLLVRDASPDGMRLFRVFLSGAPAVPVTSPPPFEMDANIAVSPDGQRFAFVRHRAGSDHAICVAPAQEQGPDASRDPCVSRFPNILSLAWRWDGKGIYVADRSALWFVALDGPAREAPREGHGRLFQRLGGRSPERQAGLHPDLL